MNVLNLSNINEIMENYILLCRNIERVNFLVVSSSIMPMVYQPHSSNNYVSPQCLLMKLHYKMKLCVEVLEFHKKILKQANEHGTNSVQHDIINLKEKLLEILF